MPLYTITTQAGVLDDSAKADLAENLTAFHAEYAAVPKNWVHIVFHEYPIGSGFTAGRPSPTVALTLLIRIGRSADYKREMLKRLWSLVQAAAGAPQGDRLGYSRSSTQSGDGNGTGHARHREFLSRPSRKGESNSVCGATSLRRTIGGLRWLMSRTE
jgi:phenylpyruvate tautomerase PptA (4-oxalocrotonate tautomerase family)